MFTRQREKPVTPHVIALVELDMRKMRVRIVLAREAIRERIREMEHSREKPYGAEDLPRNSRLEG
jgi:hypothetical protein